MTQTVENTKRVEEQRFEFLLYINNHIICQRYFNIKDYNEACVNSTEIKELMDSIVGMNNGQFGELGIIPRHLQKKTLEFLWEGYNPYSIVPEANPKKIFDNPDYFQFEIKVDKKTIGKGEFCGNVFPTKVRYAVDIKEIIPSIMTEIRDYLSLKKYNKVSV